MTWRNISSASVGPSASIIGVCDGPSSGWGTENISLNTGDARDKTSLWAWNYFPPEVRRMMSASERSCHSTLMVKVADKKWEQGTENS